MSESLFFERDLGLFNQFQIDLDLLYIGKLVRQKFVSIEHLLLKEEVSQSPLNRRRWVLQERLLSRRNLHFCPREVFFECRESACSETLPDARQLAALCQSDDSSYFKIAQAPPENAIEVLQPSELPNTRRQDYVYHTWGRIVETYSQCELTFSSDKLIALAGLALHMKTMMEDTYVAGLWLRCLPTQLLWSTELRSLKVPRTKERPWPQTLCGVYRAFRRLQLICRLASMDPSLKGKL